MIHMFNYTTKPIKLTKYSGIPEYLEVFYHHNRQCMYFDIEISKDDANAMKLYNEIIKPLQNIHTIVRTHDCTVKNFKYHPIAEYIRLDDEYESDDCSSNPLGKIVGKKLRIYWDLKTSHSILDLFRKKKISKPNRHKNLSKY